MQSFKSGIGYYVGLTVLFLCILANASRAVELQQFETEQSEVQILAVRDTEKKGEGGWLGIRFVLKPGWKTYWRHPGDAGAPMTVDWSKSENLDVKPFLWPAHKRYVEPWGMDVYGYKDEVIFPAGFSVADPAKPVRLKGTVHYTLCAELCIPYSHEVDAVIPMDVEVNKAHKASIDAALASVPKASGANGLSIDRYA